MEIIDKTTFFNLTKNFEIIPYTQFRGIYEFHALSGTNKIKFFINDKENPTIACFGHEKSFGLIKMILIEGECYLASKDITTNNIKTFYTELTLIGYDIIEVCSNAPFDFKYETALRQGGYLRPVGQFTMPVTKIIDLTTDVSYTKNWHQNIKKANKFDLVFEPVNDLQLSDCESFISIYHEMSDRKSLGNSLTVEQIYALCKAGDFKLFFVLFNNKRITATIIHERKTHAGSLYATTNNEALKLSASFFMYSQLLEYLKQHGFESFDMEKLIPSTKAVNSVFLFKNGINGTFLQLNGEWSWYKKQYYRPLMYFVKKYLMKKKEL